MRLRSRQINGAKFWRQHPIGRYVVDFCCLEAKLIIELDGGEHVEQEEPDRQRTDDLRHGAIGFFAFGMMRF